VPAFKACTSSNGSHGAPLAEPSCSPSLPASEFLTVGTPEVNGKPAGATGTVDLEVVGESPIDPGNGDQSDVLLSAQLTDVRRSSDLADYGGELQVATALRITDRYNGPFSDEPATASEVPLAFTMNCIPSADPSVGATCNASTTADAVSAGTVREGRRAVWALGPIEVFDGGADGVASTGGNTLFAHQGFFVP
jgi:hypothetical protein